MKMPMSTQETTLFDDEKSMLVASITDNSGRKVYSVDGHFGLAISELQFRKALSLKEHPEVERWTAGKLMSARDRLAAEWAKALSKEEEKPEGEPEEEAPAPPENAAKRGKATKAK